ncbi:hypothetical protein GCM10018779_31450 [Streptomyces griseocarneus]|nr:hypothetical protein GCM10018779_31450 [Streptomyces griseocarneus]
MGGAFDGEDEEHDRAGHGERPDQIDTLPGPVGPLGLGDEDEGGDQDDERQDYGREEHPAPVGRGQQPPDDQADGEASGRGARVDQKGLVALRPLLEAGRDDGQPGRSHERGGDPRHEAGGDERRSIVGEAAQAGEEQEHGEPEQKHLPAAEEVRRSSAQQHEPAVTHDVGAHHPLQLTGGHPQVGTDRRQGHIEHGHIDALQEDRSTQYEEHSPGAPAQTGGAGLRRW